jgi:hypothetical protein
MEFKNHRITKIKFKKRDGKPPKMQFDYTAMDPEQSIRKAARDKYEEAPHPDFASVWEETVQYWKENIELILGDVFWSMEDARPTTIEMEHNSKGRITSVRYFVTITTQYEQDVSIAPPTMPPGDENEHNLLKNLHYEAKEYLKGKRAQGDMFASMKDDNGDMKPEVAN